jgi:hypothetical protein
MAISQINQNSLASGVPTITQTNIGSGVAGTGPTFVVTMTGSAQSISSGTWTKAVLNAELIDTNNCVSSGTFTPNVAGYYQINGTLFIGGTGLSRTLFGFYKNGAEYLVWWNDQSPDSGQPDRVSGSTVVYCNGTTDYIELYAYITGTSPTIRQSDSVTQLNGTAFSGSLVRAA